MPSIASMVLKEVLPDYGCHTLTALARGLGLPKQYAWLLWHGKIALSLELLRRIHATFSVPVEVLMQVERAEPAKRRGRKPLGQHPKGRPSTPPEASVC
jgi:transcriptional regulator with XRE-family HTH domain